MPELRSRQLRNRASDIPNPNHKPITQQQPQPRQPPSEKLTARTRRRRRTTVQNRRNGKVERNAIGVATVKYGAIVEARLLKGEEQGQEQQELGVGAGVLREGVGERPMDEYDSRGRSGDKGQGAEDEGTTAPLPEKVYF